MHPNCRSTTQLVLDENYKKEEKEVVKVGANENKNNEAKETNKNSAPKNFDDKPVLIEKGTQKKGSEIPKEEAKKDNKAITEEILNKPYKDISDNEKLIEKMHAQVNNLDEDEKKALLKYAKGYEGEFYAINGTLRKNLAMYEEMSGAKISQEMQNKVNNWIKNIDKAMEKSYIPKNTLLYRGGIDNALGEIFKNDKLQELVLNNPVNEDNLKQVIKLVKEKDFTEKAFMSTSYIKKSSFPGKVKLRINAPQNLKGLMLDTSEIGVDDEHEVLLNRGYTWLVKDVFIEKNYATNENQFIFDCHFVK